MLYFKEQLIDFKQNIDPQLRLITKVTKLGLKKYWKTTSISHENVKALVFSAFE